MNIKKQNIGVCVLLYYITFGVYAIYWYYRLIINLRILQDDKSSYVRELLCLLFVPFYSIYWWYTRGKRIRLFFTENGYNVIGNETLYLILTIFGFSIISMAIMQNDFNSLPFGEIPKSNHKSIMIVFAIIAFVVFSSIGYYTLSYRDKQIREQGFFELSEAYIINNESFESEYGTVIEVKKDTDNSRQKGQNNESIVPCIVSVENGNRYRVWVSIIGDKNENDDIYSVKRVELLEQHN